jgi:hypothetical protein
MAVSWLPVGIRMTSEWVTIFCYFRFHFISLLVELSWNRRGFVRFLRSQDIRLLVKAPLCKMRTTDLSLKDSSHGWRMLYAMGTAV